MYWFFSSLYLAATNPPAISIATPFTKGDCLRCPPLSLQRRFSKAAG